MKDIILLFFLLSSTCFFCQSTTTNEDTLSSKVFNTFKYKKLIIPATLITYGVLSLNSSGLKSVDLNVKSKLVGNSKTTIDDYTRFAPAIAVYGLNAIGCKGKNNLKDRSIILVTSYSIASASFFSIKALSKIERPDASNNSSFPSGHTAIAFAGAEFLYQEYKDVSLWYGISGYLIASATGYLRIYNNRHWFSDVVMGAGIGILSTKIAYWIHPYIDGLLFKSNEKADSAVVVPFYNGNQLGVGLLININ